MSNFLNNTTDLEKILNEIEEIYDLIARIRNALSGGNSGSDDEENNTPSTPALINFTVDEIAYQAEEGMTWAEWCDSNYNNHEWYEWYVASSGITYADEWITLDDNTRVIPTDIIIANYDYFIIIDGMEEV